MIEEERFLITGALGCIGSWTVANLVWSGAAVTTYDLGDDPYRLQYLLDETELEKVDFVQGDISRRSRRWSAWCQKRGSPISFIWQPCRCLFAGLIRPWGRGSM